MNMKKQFVLLYVVLCTNFYCYGLTQLTKDRFSNTSFSSLTSNKSQVFSELPAKNEDINSNRLNLLSRSKSMPSLKSFDNKRLNLYPEEREFKNFQHVGTSIKVTKFSVGSSWIILSPNPTPSLPTDYSQDSCTEEKINNSPLSCVSLSSSLKTYNPSRCSTSLLSYGSDAEVNKIINEETAASSSEIQVAKTQCSNGTPWETLYDNADILDYAENTGTQVNSEEKTKIVSTLSINENSDSSEDKQHIIEIPNTDTSERDPDSSVLSPIFYFTDDPQLPSQFSMQCQSCTDSSDKHMKRSHNLDTKSIEIASSKEQAKLPIQPTLELLKNYEEQLKLEKENQQRILEEEQQMKEQEEAILQSKKDKKLKCWRQEFKAKNFLKMPEKSVSNVPPDKNLHEFVPCHPPVDGNLSKKDLKLKKNKVCNTHALSSRLAEKDIVSSRASGKDRSSMSTTKGNKTLLPSQPELQLSNMNDSAYLMSTMPPLESIYPLYNDSELYGANCPSQKMNSTATASHVSCKNKNVMTKRKKKKKIQVLPNELESKGGKQCEPSCAFDLSFYRRDDDWEHFRMPGDI